MWFLAFPKKRARPLLQRLFRDDAERLSAEFAALPMSQTTHSSSLTAALTSMVRKRIGHCQPRAEPSVCLTFQQTCPRIEAHGVEKREHIAQAACCRFVRLRVLCEGGNGNGSYGMTLRW